MTAWITLLPVDLNDYLAAAQVDAIRTKALAIGQSDPLVEIITDVTRRIRTEIRGCPSNRVSATDEAVPPELKSTAIALIVEAAQTRLPGLKLSEGQKRAADHGRSYLLRIARCEVPVSAPDNPQEPPTEQRGGRIEVVASRSNPLSGKSLGGL